MVDSLLDWVEDTGMAPKLAMLLLLAVFASLIVFQFVVAPQHQRARAFQQTLQSLDHRLAEMKQQSAPLERLNGEMDVLTPKVAAQKKLLGIHIPVGHMLPDIVDTAQSVGVTLTSWQPEEPRLIPKTNLDRVMFRLDAEGRYQALAHFLEALQRLPKVLIVRSMDYRVRAAEAADQAINIHASFELIGFQATASAQIGQRAPDQAITS